MESQNTSLTDSEDRETFLDKLYKFHKKLGNQIKRIPMLGGRELDIYHLYTKVKSFGGSKVVQDRRLWGEVARSFNLPSSVTSASYAIRQHYIKLLEKYEYYLLDPITNDPFNSPINLPRPPIHAPPPTTKAPPIVTVKKTENDKDSVVVSRLVRSLLSGYPNEVDFAFNVLTILSHQGGVVLHSQPHLLAVMLAHVGIFSDDDPGLEAVYHECWYQQSSLDFLQFWELTVPEWIFVPLFSAPFTRASHVSTLFNPHTLPTDESVEGLRVTQLSLILHNLSFPEPSARYLANNQAVHRFLLLTANNLLPSIKTLSLDTIANLSPYITLPPHTPHTPHSPLKSLPLSSPLKSPLKGHKSHGPPTAHTSDLLMGTLYECVHSQDKSEVLRGVESLGELSWHPDNWPHLLTTPSDIYHRIFQLLLLPDPIVILTCLDALYNLSFSSREMARTILRVERSVHILVSLLLVKTENISGTTNKVKIFERKVVSKVTSAQAVVQSVANRKAVTAKISSGSSSVTRTDPPRSIKIGNTTIPTIQPIKLPISSQGQLSNSPLPKMLSTSSGQNFIPVLSVQQLQELLRTMSPSSKASAVSMAGGGVRVNVLSTTPATTSKTAGKPGGQSSPNVAGSKMTPTVSGSKVAPVKSQGSKVIESLLTGSSGRGLSQKAMDPEQFTKQWLSSCYEECAGSYVSPLEMYSSYLKACSELKGQVRMIPMAEFNTTIKKLFPNSLSTKITLSGTTVFMVAGLAKKATPTGGSRETVTVITKPINVDAIRGPTSSSGLTTSLTSSKTSLTSSKTSLTSVPVTVPQKPHGIPTTSKGPSMTTPTLKSGVQRSETRPASPLTVARRALDWNAPEVKGQTSQYMPIPMMAKDSLAISINTKAHESPGTQQKSDKSPSIGVKGQIGSLSKEGLTVKPFTSSPLTNHMIIEDNVCPPPMKKVCVEGVSGPTLTNGPVSVDATSPVGQPHSGECRPSTNQSEESVSTAVSSAKSPSPLATPMDCDTPTLPTLSNCSTPSLVTTTPVSTIAQETLVPAGVNPCLTTPPPATKAVELSRSPTDQSDDDLLMEHSTVVGKTQLPTSEGGMSEPLSLGPTDEANSEHSNTRTVSEAATSDSATNVCVAMETNDPQMPNERNVVSQADQSDNSTQLPPSLSAPSPTTLQNRMPVDEGSQPTKSEESLSASRASLVGNTTSPDQGRSGEHSTVNGDDAALQPATGEPVDALAILIRDFITDSDIPNTPLSMLGETPMETDMPTPSRSPPPLTMSIHTPPVGADSSHAPLVGADSSHAPLVGVDRDCESQPSPPAITGSGMGEPLSLPTNEGDSHDAQRSTTQTIGGNTIDSVSTESVAMETDEPNAGTPSSAASLQRSEVRDVQMSQSDDSTEMNRTHLLTTEGGSIEPLSLVSTNEGNSPTTQTVSEAATNDTTTDVHVAMETNPIKSPPSENTLPQRSESTEAADAPDGVFPVVVFSSLNQQPSTDDSQSGSPSDCPSDKNSTVDSSTAAVGVAHRTTPPVPKEEGSDMVSRAAAQTSTIESTVTPSSSAGTRPPSVGDEVSQHPLLQTSVHGDHPPPVSTVATPPLCEPHPLAIVAVDHDTPPTNTPSPTPSQPSPITNAPSSTPSQPPLTDAPLSTPSQPSPLIDAPSSTPSQSSPLTSTPSLAPSQPSPLSNALSLTPSLRENEVTSTNPVKDTHPPSVQSDSESTVEGVSRVTEEERSTANFKWSPSHDCPRTVERSVATSLIVSQSDQGSPVSCGGGVKRMLSEIATPTPVNLDPHPHSTRPSPTPSHKSHSVGNKLKGSTMPTPSHVLVGSSCTKTNTISSTTDGSTIAVNPFPFVSGFQRVTVTPPFNNPSVSSLLSTGPDSGRVKPLVIGQPKSVMTTKITMTTRAPTPSHKSHSVGSEGSTPSTPSHKSHSVGAEGSTHPPSTPSHTLVGSSCTRTNAVTSTTDGSTITVNPFPFLSGSSKVTVTPPFNNPSVSTSASPLSRGPDSGRVNPLAIGKPKSVMTTKITMTTRANVSITSSAPPPLNTNTQKNVTTQLTPSKVLTVPAVVTMVTTSTSANLSPASGMSQGRPNQSKSDPVPDFGLSLLAQVCDTVESGTRPICLWRGCASVRLNWAELFHHVVHTHLPSDHTHPLVCQWAGCSSTAKRMRPSLLYHIQSHHCSPDPPPSPPNVARTLLKIKQSHPLTEDTESVLTKSVRLTAGLILRNLVRALPEAKQRLLPYEAQLSGVACSGSEAAVAVAECLYLINNTELSWQQ